MLPALDDYRDALGAVREIVVAPIVKGCSTCSSGRAPPAVICRSARRPSRSSSSWHAGSRPSGCARGGHDARGRLGVNVSTSRSLIQPKGAGGVLVLVVAATDADEHEAGLLDLGYHVAAGPSSREALARCWWESAAASRTVAGSGRQVDLAPRAAVRHNCRRLRLDSQSRERGGCRRDPARPRAARRPDQGLSITSRYLRGAVDPIFRYTASHDRTPVPRIPPAHWPSRGIWGGDPVPLLRSRNGEGAGCQHLAVPCGEHDGYRRATVRIHP